MSICLSEYSSIFRPFPFVLLLVLTFFLGFLPVLVVERLKIGGYVSPHQPFLTRQQRRSL